MIKAAEPYVQPAVEETVYPGYWIYNLSIHCPSTRRGRVSVELLPYRPEEGDQPARIGPAAGLVRITTNRLLTAAATNPKIGAAFAAILDAVDELSRWVVENPDESESEPESDPPP